VDPIRIDEALDALLDSALARLTEHAEPGGLLDGIQFIERGDRTERSPRYPAIILTTGIANPMSATSIQVKYEVPLRVWSQIYSNHPATGEPEARRWAGKAWHALLREPGDDMGVTPLPGSVLMNPGAFEPPGPGVEQDTYVGRAVVLARIITTF
jgi:hypothetical protein